MSGSAFASGGGTGPPGADGAPGADGQSGGGLVASGETTSSVNITATTEGSANTLVTADAFSADGSTYRVSFSVPSVDPAGSGGTTVRFYLYEGSGSVGKIGELLLQSDDVLGYSGEALVTPAAGTRTYSIRATTSTGTSVAAGGAGGSGNVLPIAISVDAFSSGGGGGGGAGVSDDIAQTGHGLAVQDVVMFDGADFVLAQADDAVNAEVVGIVSAVADADNFTLQMGGLVEGLSGLSAGDLYFLSDSVAGELTTTEPTALGAISKPLLVAISTTAGYFFNWRGFVVGGDTGLFNAYAVLRDEKAAATQGGTFTSGAWRTRDLNTESDPDGIVTLSSNQFTLAAGSYLVMARAPAHHVDGHQCRLYNVTDSAVAVDGSASFSASANDYAQTDSFLYKRITITGTKVFELQHRCTTTKTNNGFGNMANVGEPEVYSEIVIWREGSVGGTLSTPGYGTALPSSPADGDEYILVDSTTAPTYQWRFRYNADNSSSYKWEFVGGAPLASTVIHNSPWTVSSSTYAALPSAHSLTVPLAGIYHVEYSAGADAASPNGTGQLFVSVKNGSGTASDNDALRYRTDNFMTCATARRFTVTAAATALALNAKQANGNARVFESDLAITPVRVAA